MNLDNETYTVFAEKPIGLLEEVALLPNTQPAVPDITVQQLTDPIADLQQDNYTDSINNLIAKYKKVKGALLIKRT